MDEEDDDENSDVAVRKNSEDDELTPEIDIPEEDKVQDITKPTTMIFSCLGSGLQNISRIVN